MFSFNQWILRNPIGARSLYLLSVLIFFTESSFNQGRFYFQVGLLLLVYGIWCRPLFKLITYEVEKKNPDLGDRWEKLLLLNGSWLFLLIPFKLILIDILSLWDYRVFGLKFIIFLIVVFVVIYSCVRTLRQRNEYAGSIVAWSLVKNFFLLLLIPVWVVLFFPFFFALFYYL